VALGVALRPGAGGGHLVAVHRRPQRHRRRPAPAPEPTVDDPPDVSEPGPGPADAAETEWVSWRVHRALETLPAQERSLVELAYWGGMSQTEIAEYVGLPLGTVKTRTRSALRRLADDLGDDLA
jgi:RNA polymerase sigma-70 factor (ECF subfamily)